MIYMLSATARRILQNLEFVSIDGTSHIKYCFTGAPPWPALVNNFAVSC